MKRSKYSFDLPEELVAKYPCEERDESRLMVLHRDTQKIEHKQFKDLIDYMEEEDTLVTNDTKVLPARLYGHKEKTRAKIEVTLLRELEKDTHLWDVLVYPARKIRVGNKLYFGDDTLVAEVLDNTTSRGRTMTFHFDGTSEELSNLIEKLGKPPLPDRMDRAPEEVDKLRFQTIYAQNPGAVTVPSAGLHFTKHLLKRLEVKGINIAPITMHMGMGNCYDIDVEDLSKYKMTSENYHISPEVSQMVNTSKKNKHKVFSVGVGTTKGLESNTSIEGLLKPTYGGAWTDLFIYPPYEFKICDALITNLHLPLSSMLIIASAFAGYEFTMHAIQEAIKERYKFFTYGDAMLIL